MEESEVQGKPLSVLLHRPGREAVCPTVALFSLLLKQPAFYLFIFFNSGLRGGTHVYPGPIHIYVWQKELQYCKAIILQLK